MPRFLATLFLVLLMCGRGEAQNYPSRTITVIVPFGAGSGTDSVARVVTRRLSELLQVPVVVDNRVGANGAIGATAAAHAAPDGHTLMIGGVSTHAANPSLMKSIQYDPKADFIPIAELGIFPYFLIVSRDIQAANVKELVEQSRAKPGTLSFAYGNAIGQLAGEMLKARTSADLLAVPYKSSPPAITDLLAGRVSMMFVDMTAALAQVKAGQLRALATTSRERTALFPDLPSMKEAGVDLFDITAWTGFFAPKGTPPEIVARLADALHQVMDDPNVRANLAQIGFEAKWAGSAAFAEHVAHDLDLWVRLTREAGIEQQ
ncbi:MAG: tripartite tricarboxylate transporter substrate binding protein [Bradyrhizobium sp.]